MQKKTYPNTTLICQLQTRKQLSETKCLNGLISLTNGGVLFQETIPRKREIRNTKLYEGKHVSLVRRKDGLYYPLVKAIRAKGIDRSSLAFSIYSEISEALNCVE